jgi:hypothetical protein
MEGAMQELSRRAMLRGSSVAAVALAVPAAASAAVSDDAELLRLEAELAANEIECDKADEDRVSGNGSWDAVDRIGELGHKLQVAIRDTPARSGIGIAVKLRLVLRLGGNLEENYDHPDLITLSAMRDAERLAGKGGATSAVALPAVPVASTPAGDDAALLQAEQEVLKRWKAANSSGVEDEELAEASDYAQEVEEEIAAAAPSSLTGAAVKLRRLLDSTGGGHAFVEKYQRASARQILECLERHARTVTLA